MPEYSRKYLNCQEQRQQYMTIDQTRHDMRNSSQVLQALEIARESPDGAKDPVISRILETALDEIWAEVMRLPDSYIMHRDEFAVFNFFQHRFVSNRIAGEARRRYWNNLTASS